LEETYNLRGLTPVHGQVIMQIPLEETYNLRGLTPNYIPSSFCKLVGRDL